MIKFLLKLALWFALLFVAYKAAAFYSIYKLATYADECTSLENICTLARQRASNREVTAAMSSAYACIKQKQPFVESWFMPIPKHFLNPPPESLSYQDAERSCKPHPSSRIDREKVDDAKISTDGVLALDDELR